MDIEFSGEIWYWRGPQPYHFISVPEEHCDFLREEGAFVTYGWGMIPVTVQIGDQEWTTSLWPKDGGYVVPVKDAIRRAERLDQGDDAVVRLSIRG